MKRLLILSMLFMAPAAWAQNSITINWSAPSGSLTAYTVYRSTVHGGPYAAIASGITALTFTDSGMANGTYYYVITSFNGGVVTNITGNGTTATVTCAASCSFPSGSTVIIHGNSFLDGTFTSTGQPSGTTFTFASSSSGSGTAGGAWQSGAESSNSNESGAAEPIVRSVSFTPTSLTFPSTNTGSSASTQSITANNTSSLGANLTISNLAFTGTNPGDFSTSLGCVGTVAPAGSCVATVTFRPTAAGARSASLAFTDNAAGSPQSVPVGGTGASGAPAVTFLPTSLNFGQQIISTSSVARSIQVTNSGSAILVISGITFTGTNAADYSETDNCTSVSVGASCTINVTFTPSASGTRVASVSVADNVAGSPQSIPLTGVGATVQCSLAGSAALGGVASICQ